MNQGQPQTGDADRFWSPYASTSPVHDAPAVDADARPSIVRAEAGWEPVVIDGGRGRADDDAAGDADAGATTDADGFEAAVDDVFAALAEPATAPVPQPDPEPEEAPAVEPESPAAAPEQPAPEPVSAPQAPTTPVVEPDSTLRTPQPGEAPTEAATPGQGHTEAAETPHSTPPEGARVWSWRTAVGWLNLYQVLDQPLPPVREIYQSAWASVADRTGLDRVTEIAVVCGIGVPLSVAARIVDAAGHSKWRLLGLSATAVLWTLAAASAPVDASTLAWWTLAAYWASTVTVIPAVIKATQ